ncbi:hypothetical protein [Archangium violaceum]|uniref:hypothetical protein n=1 Tax=Archangium violaceum TaxID=83451 RepID=UPI0037BF7031
MSARLMGPCLVGAWRSPWWGAMVLPGVEAQLLKYDELGGNCPPAIVTPLLGISP